MLCQGRFSNIYMQLYIFIKIIYTSNFNGKTTKIILISNEKQHIEQLKYTGITERSHTTKIMV